MVALVNVGSDEHIYLLNKTLLIKKKQWAQFGLWVIDVWEQKEWRMIRNKQMGGMRLL